MGYLAEKQQIAGRQISAWSVFAEIKGPQGLAVISTGCRYRSACGHGGCKINGVNAAQADLAQAVTLSWLTRRWMVCSSGHHQRADDLLIGWLLRLTRPIVVGLARYEKVWRERTRLLADGQADDKWCISLEKILAETGMAISALDLHLLKILTVNPNIWPLGSFGWASLTGQAAGLAGWWLSGD